MLHNCKSVDLELLTVFAFAMAKPVFWQNWWDTKCQRLKIAKMRVITVSN